MADPFDEFEMRPITDGLGFHKKAVKLSDSVTSSKLARKEILSEMPTLPPADLVSPEKDHASRSSRRTLEEIIASLEMKQKVNGANASQELKFSETLPREKRQTQSLDINVPLQRDFPNVDILEDLPVPATKTTLDQTPPNVGTRRGAADTPAPRLLPESASFSSAVIDALIVLAISLIFLLSLLVATKSQLFNVVINLQSDSMTQISMLILYFAVMEMYVVISRCFFGMTLGEWTFDLQMGNDEQIAKLSYPFKVLWRSVVVLVTGIIVLPIFSMAIGKDLIAVVTGLQLYKRQ